MHECFHVSHGVPVTRANILGVLSLIFWALIVIVTLKYHIYVLRADYLGIPPARAIELGMQVKL